MNALSVLSLRVELQRRGLSTRGVKSALHARLSAAIEQTAGSKLTVPARFPAPPQSGAFGTAKRRQSHQQQQLTEDERAIKRAKLDVVGYVMSSAVWVTGAEHMAALWDVADGYGKGNLSRSEPVYAGSRGPRSVTKNGRAARQLLLLEKAGAAAQSAAEKDDVEHLQLTFVESFHATFVGMKMRLVSGVTGQPLDDELSVWRLFCKNDPHFAHVYAAYARYRQAGWMPRSGLKYGVDWVLYAAGSKRHAHSPYCVVLSHDARPIESSWIRLQNKLRLVKNVAKNLIASRVHLPFTDTGGPQSPQDAVESVQLIELTIDRWVS
jgi:tRNA-intron lyase